MYCIYTYKAYKIKGEIDIGKTLRSHCYLLSVEVFVQQLCCLQSLWHIGHRSKPQHRLLSESWPPGTECCWTHLQSWWNDFERSCHIWQSLSPCSSTRSTPALSLASVVSRPYCSLSCYTQIWCMTSSPSLQVFSPQMETGPVWSRSKLLEEKKWRTLSNKLVQLEKKRSRIDSLTMRECDYK